MNRFEEIISNLVYWGNAQERLHAAIVVGSQAREDHPADAFSDLDVLLLVSEPDHFIQSDEWLREIGEYAISFTENTIDGDVERRVLFAGARDVDFVIIPFSRLEGALRAGSAAILTRGYRVLVDKIGISADLPSIARTNAHETLPAEGEFLNQLNDFWYHAVWAAKKIQRGELWVAQACVNAYMKERLLSLIRWHTLACCGAQIDTWHGGRFLEQWAQAWIVRELADCYSHYERGDVIKALVCTMNLARRIAQETALCLNYSYPERADRTATKFVLETLVK